MTGVRPSTPSDDPVTNAYNRGYDDGKQDGFSQGHIHGFDEGKLRSSVIQLGLGAISGCIMTFVLQGLWRLFSWILFHA